MSAYGTVEPVLALPDEICVDGLVDASGRIVYWGKATRMPSGKFRCLAAVDGCLCIVEVSIAAMAEAP